MAEMLEAMIRLENEMKEIELPFIVLQASEDKLVDPISAKTLYEQAKSSDKTLRIYDGLYHEIFNEPERELVLQDVADWLDDHL
jgi:alpha-beta hydrolase superfamily lysophospholipase